MTTAVADNPNSSVVYYTDLFKGNATHKMNPVAKQLLVDALRSGDYAQTLGYLQVVEDVDEVTPVGFCCLGVLSEIAKDQGVAGVDCALSTTQPVMMYFSQNGWDKSSAFLIDPIAEWADMPDGISGALMGLNDAGMSFPQIADLIEEYL